MKKLMESLISRSYVISNIGSITTATFQAPRPGWIVGAGFTVSDSSAASEQACVSISRRQLLNSAEQAASGEDIIYMVCHGTLVGGVPVNYIQSVGVALFMPLRFRMQLQQIVYVQLTGTGQCNGVLQFHAD